MNAMQRRTNEEIINSMFARFDAAHIVFDKEAFKEKIINLETNTLSETLRKMAMGNKENMLEAIKGFNIQANIVDPKASEKDVKEEAKKKLNLSDITEFENNNKGYFKFKDKDGNITLARNMGDNAKDLFLNLLNDGNIASKQDGRENAAEIFNFLREKKLIEVDTKTSKNIESSNESKKNKAIVKEMQKHFPGKEIIYSSVEQIYIVKGNNNEEDIVIGINQKDGKLKINQIKQKGYEDNQNAKTETETSLSQEEIFVELNKDDAINEIIVNNKNNNIPDEMTMEQIKSHVDKKYPAFKNNNAVLAAISVLIARSKTTITNDGNQNSLGRQYVLKSNQSILPTDYIAA